MNIFITGIAGMIGFHVTKLLTNKKYNVIGVDNFNDYYDVELKKERSRILAEANVEIINSDIRNIKEKDWEKLFNNVDLVLHLAAYANPRHSLDNEQLYIDNNITGTHKLIKAIEKNNINKVVYASSSCVMHGQNLPWNEKDDPKHQNNPYGWTKRVNECQFLSSNIKQSIGLRFFTVYGPYGRPDMALFSFTKNIINGEKIKLYNYGDMKRDFTYIDDIISGISLVIDKLKNENSKYHEIYNIGYGQQVKLQDFVYEIEKNLGRKAEKELCESHPADTPVTWADITKIKSLGYNPKTSIKDGVEKFISWYKDYYKVN